MMTATPVFDQVWPLKYSGVDSGARPPAVQHLASGRCHQADGSWRAGLFSAVVEDARRTFRAILDGENRKTDLTSLRGSDSRPKSGPEEDEFKHSGLRTRGSGRQSPKSTAAAAGRISWPTSARFRRFRSQDRASGRLRQSKPVADGSETPDALHLSVSSTLPHRRVLESPSAPPGAEGVRRRLMNS